MFKEYTSFQRAFLGNQAKLEEADVVVIPVPYDSTTSYGGGTKFGPSAIIDASAYLEMYDIELDRNISDSISVYTMDSITINKDSPKKTIDNLAEAVKKVVSLGKKPVTFGGEHSISVGPISAFEDISVLQIDAHTDLRDYYEGSKFSHGCIMRRVREKTKDTVAVGIRSMCLDEAEYIKKEKMEDRIIFADEVRRSRVNGSINPKLIDRINNNLTDKIYVTVDIDGFDPSLIGGTGTPEPAGLIWEDVIDIMKNLKGEVVGFDIVEVAPAPPIRSNEFVAAKLAYKMMGYFW